MIPQRERQVILSLAIGLVAVGIATADGTVGSTVALAIEETTLAHSTAVLADRALFLGVGGLLVGVGIGVIVASGVTFWHYNRKIEERLG